MEVKQLAAVAGIILLVVAAIIGFQMSSGTNQDNQKPMDLNFPTQGNSASSQAPVTNLQIEEIKIGTGSAVKAGDTVTVNYKGTLLNGQQFDSSYDRHQPFTTEIGVGKVIQGWDEGIVGMKTGGVRKLTIPPSMGYGNQQAGSIPPNSVLVFQVELLSIEEPSPSPTESPSSSSSESPNPTP